MNAKESRNPRGIPLRRVNFITSILVMILSILLLAVTLRTDSTYRQTQDSTEDYIRWQQAAHDLQAASDYLTEEARCFVMTGHPSHLENYFEEVAVTRRRETALAVLEEDLADTEADKHLHNAMRESVSLSNLECYAMRLVVDARGYPLADYPEEIQDVPLSTYDEALSPAAKEALADSLLFNADYSQTKSAISRNTQLCLECLLRNVTEKQASATQVLHDFLIQQRAMIILIFFVFLSVRFLTLFLVIQPVVQSVQYIRDDQPLPIRGGAEFRFLAKTYNLMFASHQERTVQLAFDATHDKLTGLYNRSGYDFLVDNVDLDTCALLILDVDHFKEINDTYGHETGDRVLADAAGVIARYFRPQDYVCRIGGDEFAVIAVKLGRNSENVIRKKIEVINEALSYPPEGLPAVSLSVGVAFGGGGLSYAAIFRNADAALYHVKQNGRRNCAFFPAA